MNDIARKPEIINTVEPESGPIHNTEIERTVLATLMSVSQAITECNDILTPDCFFDTANREIFEAVIEVYNQGNFPDMMLVSSELGKRGSSITPLEVTELVINTAKVIDIHPHALILKDYSLRRKLWETAYNLMCQAANESYPLQTIHQEAKEKIDSLYEVADAQLPTLQTTYKELQERMLINMNMPEGQIIGTPTSFQDIDKNGGLCGGDLIIVGAETSQGKTSFATALSISAIENGDGVAFYSLEMTALQLTARIASMKSGISSSRIMNQRLTIEEIYRIDSCMDGFDTSKMYFDERSTSSLDSILMSIRSMKMKYGIKGAVVDYLQLVNSKEKGMNIEQMTAEGARKLKNIAKELDIWIIAISQLSRNPQNPVPSMSRLRNSGQIEEAADLIVLIYRPRDTKNNYPEPFANVSTDGTAMVMIEKNRNGATGKFVCGFNSENTLFFPMNEYQISQLNCQIITSQKDNSNNDLDMPF